MAIINFTFDASRKPANAVGVHHAAGYPIWLPNGQNNPVYAEGPHVYWIWEECKGLCLKEREMNGYNDSDFFMTYWDEAKQEPVEVLFASTRGWSYPALGSKVDATDEVKAKYAAWQAKKAAEYRANQRKAKAKMLVNVRKAVSEFAKANQVSYAKVLKLRHTGKLDNMLKLFGSRIRSGFKLSMRNQLLAWLRDPSPKYATPFSRKQMEWL